MAPVGGRGGGASGGNDDNRREKNRRQSIKNRTQTICKKAQELSILCDLDVALVCYPPGISGPTTWPPDRSKIEEAVRRYVGAPAKRKLPKNQITFHDSSAGADKRADSGKAAAVEKAARLRIPFPDDEDKLRELGGVLESRLEEVQKMIAIRRMERRGDPRPSTQDSGSKKARGRAGMPPRPPMAVASVDCGGDPGTSDRDRGKRVAPYYGPAWGWGRPAFSAPPAAATACYGEAGNFLPSCPCCYCPVHIHRFVGSNGSIVSSDRSNGQACWGEAPNLSRPCPCCYCPVHGYRFVGSNGRIDSRDGSNGK